MKTKESDRLVNVWQSSKDCVAINTMNTVLRLIKEGLTTSTELAERCCCSRSHINSVLQALIKIGAVERERVNGKSFSYYPTDSYIPTPPTKPVPQPKVKTKPEYLHQPVCGKPVPLSEMSDGWILATVNKNLNGVIGKIRRLQNTDWLFDGGVHELTELMTRIEYYLIEAERSKELSQEMAGLLANRYNYWLGDNISLFKSISYSWRYWESAAKGAITQYNRHIEQLKARETKKHTYLEFWKEYSKDVYDLDLDSIPF